MNRHIIRAVALGLAVLGPPLLGPLGIAPLGIAPLGLAPPELLGIGVGLSMPMAIDARPTLPAASVASAWSVVRPVLGRATVNV